MLAERGGEVVGLSWSLPSFIPGYCIQTAARPSLMEVSEAYTTPLYGGTVYVPHRFKGQRSYAPPIW